MILTRLYLGLIVITATNSLTAFEFQATGRLEGKRFHAGSLSKQLPPATFEVNVRDCNWSIVLDIQDPLVYRLEVSYDGTNQYRYSYEKGIAAAGRTHVASVSPYEIPDHPAIHLPLLWMALAPSCYLDANGDFLPPFFKGLGPMASEKVQVIRHPDKIARLPETISFFRSPHTESPEIDRADSSSQAKVEARFEALDFFQVGDIAIPRQFRFRVYRSGGTETNETNIQLLYQGRIHEAEPAVTAESFVPILRTNAVSFSDYRLVASNSLYRPALRYVTNHWLTMAEVSSLPHYDRYVALEPLMRNVSPSATIINQPPKVHIAYRVLFAAIVLFALTIAVKSWVNQRKAQHTERIDK